MADTATHEPTEVHDDEHHPTARQYVEIAVVLAVLTAMEVAASFIDIGPAFLPTLIVLMTIKFILVAGWFMHLKYDTRLYTRLVVTGLGMAIVLYAIVLAVFSTAVRA
jgi:cytochrome c oxidase subunit 4